MREIRGKKYKLAGIGVRQKGTLVDVFAEFCGVDENIDDYLTDKPAVAKEPAKPGSTAAMLQGLPPIPRGLLLPSLSVDDIVEAVIGKRDLQKSFHHEIHITDTEGVIADLGPEKLTQILVEMGETRRKILAEGMYAFVPQTSPKIGL